LATHAEVHRLGRSPPRGAYPSLAVDARVLGGTPLHGGVAVHDAGQGDCPPPPDDADAAHDPAHESATPRRPEVAAVPAGTVPTEARRSDHAGAAEAIKFRRRTKWPLWVGAAAALLLALTEPDHELGPLASAVLQVLLNGLGAALAFGAARRLPGRERLGWTLFASAGTIAAVVLVAVIGVVLAGGPEPGSNIILPLLAVVNACTFIGFLLLSPPDLANRSSARFALDGLIVAGSILFMLLTWTGPDGGQAPSLQVLLYPAIDAGALTVLLLVLAHRRGHVPAWPSRRSWPMAATCCTSGSSASRP
jgi:hypothetical protein